MAGDDKNDWPASVSRLPWRSGDGYGWGGEVVLTIGLQSLLFGNDRADEALAREIARRWNAGRAALTEADGNG